MKLWQVTPLGRPSMVRRVCSQFENQNYADKRLCLAINGDGWKDLNPTKHLEQLGVHADMVITTGDGKPCALNTAVDAIRKLDERVAIIVRDDDDHFSKDGFEEFAELLPSNDIVGQLRHWVWDGESLWLLNRRAGNLPGHSNFWGGNFGFWPNGAVEFPDLKVGEVHAWASKMVLGGSNVWFKSRHFACIDRTQSDHLWEASFTMVRYRSEGSALRFDGWDWDLITGKRSCNNGFEVSKPTTEEAHLAEHRRMLGG